MSKTKTNFHYRLRLWNFLYKQQTPKEAAKLDEASDEMVWSSSCSPLGNFLKFI